MPLVNRNVDRQRQASSRPVPAVPSPSIPPSLKLGRFGVLGAFPRSSSVSSRPRISVRSARARLRKGEAADLAQPLNMAADTSAPRNAGRRSVLLGQSQVLIARIAADKRSGCIQQGTRLLHVTNRSTCIRYIIVHG
ncbi:PREDICTED: uncharacterized protein LOC105564493 [Vollenhovia emeryi]|uniref:uncharacterized protein LOC105564493 n=1 Tax=Vollenhovia emeryi TaxID=411798 RepID=UPI0005F4B13F|nr:PREDICTED: uncharacterized protein LOC105564493 [Vollenhovia emeryi]